ncbi:MAG: helix-turn-helix domain-containing protein, partial [Candidatus Zixiibacteriota bacterium]
KKTVSGSSKKLLTTGEAAALCSVTPDTVYKWIRAGKIPAHRTPGGHHRIERSALSLYTEESALIPDSVDPGSAFQYCWEFNSKSGVLSEGCRECIVYRSRTRRCYEISKMPEGFGYTGRFCKSSCEECEYFNLVQGQRPNVLVVTDQDQLKDSIIQLKTDRSLNLEITDCEYRCSMLIDRFRPDYVVIDCSLGARRSRDFAQLLYDDPRVPLVRVVLVGSRKDLPEECNQLVFALINKQLRPEMLIELVRGAYSPSYGDRPEQNKRDF